MGCGPANPTMTDHEKKVQESRGHSAPNMLISILNSQNLPWLLAQDWNSLCMHYGKGG